MAKAVFHTTILNTATGLPVPNAEVGIIDATTGAYAPLWSDRDGNVTVSPNPTTADSDGFLEVYVTPGRFRIEADDGNGGTQTWEDELIGIVEEPYLSITSVTADDSATVDFLSGLTEAGIYTLTCNSLTVANDGDSIRLRVSTDGTTVETGATDYNGYNSWASSPSGYAASYAGVADSLGNDTGEDTSVRIDISVDDDGRVFIVSSRISFGVDGSPDGGIIPSRYVGTGVTGIRLYASTGNIATGTFTLRKIG